jgi:hypothetical protein
VSATSARHSRVQSSMIASMRSIAERQLRAKAVDAQLMHNRLAPRLLEIAWLTLAICGPSNLW